MLLGLAEIPVREDGRSHEGPEEESEAEPTGAHLHPDCRHAALHGLVAGVRSVDTWEKVILNLMKTINCSLRIQLF